MRGKFVYVVFLALFITACFHQPPQPLVLDSFEDSCGSSCIDFGAGNGSKVSISLSTDKVYAGKKSLKIEYSGVPSGYMWVARGYGLTNKKAGLWQRPPQKIAWRKYGAFSFYLYGQAKGVNIAFDIKDKDNEMFRCMFRDDQRGWKQVVCPFNKFFSRSDWQPQDARPNGTIDFPVVSFQFEPRTPKSGVIYIDKVELLPREEK